MPNWKTYESSVRLLSAILAAHPELRLNYQEVSKCFGGDCTASALENRFRRIKTDAKSIKECLDKGEDPITLPIEGGRVGDAAIAGGKKISACLALQGEERNTPGLEFYFRSIKKDAQKLREKRAEGEISKYYGVDEHGEKCTKDALDHRFRPIKKQAKDMRAEQDATGGIADKYGEDVTAKAVSTRFERLKKESSWLGNEDKDTNSKVATGTGSAKSTPKKKNTPAKATVDDGSASGDDREDLAKSPLHQKGPLNKVQGGRVQKPRTPKAKNKTYVDLDSDDELVKDEAPGAHDFENHGNGGSFGYNDGDMDMDHHLTHGGYGSEEDVV